MNIIIDSEFKSLIPPLTAEEYAVLEESILKEGCRDALVLWDDVLIDGHNRYEICQRHGIPFQTVQKDFTNRNDVVIWIIQNQLGRRNLPAYERARLALRLKPTVAERAKENQVKGLWQGTKAPVPPNLAERGNETRDTIARAAGISHGTLAKVEKLEQTAPDSLKQQLRTGEVSINQAYQALKRQEQAAGWESEGDVNQFIPPIDWAMKTVEAAIEDIPQKPHVSYNSGNNEWYTPPEYIEAARETMGSIDLDPASSDVANEVVRAGTYYTSETDGLRQEWFGNVWLNPPYSTELIVQFIDKLVDERRSIQQAVVLVNNATETKWFTKIVCAASAIVFPASRVKFYMPDGRTGAPLQGQAIIYIGENSDRFLRTFSKFGWGVTPWVKDEGKLNTANADGKYSRSRT